MIRVLFYTVLGFKSSLARFDWLFPRKENCSKTVTNVDYCNGRIYSCLENKVILRLGDPFGFEEVWKCIYFSSVFLVSKSDLGCFFKW